MQLGTHQYVHISMYTSDTTRYTSVWVPMRTARLQGQTITRPHQSKIAYVQSSLTGLGAKLQSRLTGRRAAEFSAGVKMRFHMTEPLTAMPLVSNLVPNWVRSAPASSSADAFNMDCRSLTDRFWEPRDVNTRQQYRAILTL